MLSKTDRPPSTKPAFAALLGVLLQIAAAPLNANLLRNPGFETNAYIPHPSGANSLAVGDTSLAGWTVIGDVVALGIDGNPFGLTASEGSYFLDLTGFDAGAPFGGVTQDIALQAGFNYLLEFDLGTSATFGPGAAITASAAGTSMTFAAGANGSASNWARFSLTFAALSPLTSISLLGSSGTDYIGLDNLSVVQLNAVPLPAAAWLFGGALIGLYGTARRRQAGNPGPSRGVR